MERLSLYKTNMKRGVNFQDVQYAHPRILKNLSRSVFKCLKDADKPSNEVLEIKPLEKAEKDQCCDYRNDDQGRSRRDQSRRRDDHWESRGESSCDIHSAEGLATASGLMCNERNTRTRSKHTSLARSSFSTVSNLLRSRICFGPDLSLNSPCRDELY